MAVPYIFATIPNGQTIPLQYLDANFAYIETLIPTTSGVLTLSGGATGLLPNSPTAGNVILSGTLNIANGGTGETTALGAINALVPSQSGQSGKFLSTDGSTVQWSAAIPGTGTVTSVNVSGGSTGLTTSGGPIIGAGIITLSGTLNITNGGTGATTAQGATTNLLPSQAGHAGDVLSTNGSGVLTWIPAGGAASLTVGASPITGGTSSYILYDNAGVLGEISTVGTGTVVLDTGASLTTPTVTKPVLIALREQETGLTIAANAITIDCDTATVFHLPLNSSITTITFSNVPVAGKAYSLTLSVEADGTPRTITWPGSVKWPGGAAPILTSTAGKTDTFVLYTFDAGTKWFAFVAGQDA